MIKLLFLGITLLTSLLLIAPPTKHEIDFRHSQINFVANARLISAHGFFDKWEADVNLDHENVESSTVKITIDANSINTRVSPRDNHLRSKDFFWVEQYPTITFTSTKITKIKDKHFNIVGNLSMRGVTKEITVPIEMVFYENFFGRFRGTFQISRSEFGISFNSKFNPIEDLVQVQFDINVEDKVAIEKAKNKK